MGWDEGGIEAPSVCIMLCPGPLHGWGLVQEGYVGMYVRYGRMMWE
jgi:hypothetical protein